MCLTLVCVSQLYLAQTGRQIILYGGSSLGVVLLVISGVLLYRSGHMTATQSVDVKKQPWGMYSPAMGMGADGEGPN